jgi:hypothetical protein
VRGRLQHGRHDRRVAGAAAQIARQGCAHLVGIAEFPLVVAMLFAIVISLPLGIWLLAPLRRRATAGIAQVDERRRSDREQLEARLRGEAES